MSYETYTFEGEIAKNNDRAIMVAAIRRAFENFKRYQSFGKRILPHIEKELPEGYYAQIIGGGSRPFSTVGVAVSKRGEWDNRVTVEFYPTNMSGESQGSWQELFLKDLARYNPERDTARFEAEQALTDKLATIQSQIEALKAEALALVNDSPSYVLRQQFPTLFK